MVSKELLEILRCPNCVREKDGLLKLTKIPAHLPGLRAQIPDRR
jgi:hypothetical protein